MMCYKFHYQIIPMTYITLLCIKQKKNKMDPCPVNKEWQQLLRPTLVLLLELWFLHAWLMFLCLNARQLDCGMFCKLCQIHNKRRSFILIPCIKNISIITYLLYGNQCNYKEYMIHWNAIRVTNKTEASL